MPTAECDGEDAEMNNLELWMATLPKVKFLGVLGRRSASVLNDNNTCLERVVALSVLSRARRTSPLVQACLQHTLTPALLPLQQPGSSSRPGSLGGQWHPAGIFLGGSIFLEV